MAAATLKQHITCVKENPIELHSGKEWAFSDAEKLVLDWRLRVAGL
jgi:hypothetical protein